MTLQNCRNDTIQYQMSKSAYISHTFLCLLLPTPASRLIRNIQTRTDLTRLDLIRSNLPKHQQKTVVFCVQKFDPTCAMTAYKTRTSTRRMTCESRKICRGRSCYFHRSIANAKYTPIIFYNFFTPISYNNFLFKVVILK